jgi:hypothetical protein
MFKSKKFVLSLVGILLVGALAFVNVDFDALKWGGGARRGSEQRGEVLTHGDGRETGGADDGWDASEMPGSVVVDAETTPVVSFQGDNPADDILDIETGSGGQGTITVYLTYRKL